MRQQNLLDELQTRVRSITATVETAPAIIFDDPTSDLSKPVTIKRGSLADTDEGKEILLALGAADKLLASRLLDLMSVVCAASTNAVGWSVVEALTGASWRDYCTDEKHALVAKDALVAQEKRASDAYDRDRKDRDQCLKSPLGTNGFLNGPKVLLTNFVERHANQRQKHKRVALAALAKRFFAILKRIKP